MKHMVLLGIGGNIGDKKLNFLKATGLIQKQLGKILLASSIYETPPWGFKSENSFWNQVLKVETKLSPQEVLIEIKQIESIFGRERSIERYLSRQMDIDILFYDDLILDTEDLKIPHPLLHKRKFVVIPLAEIVPDIIHPVLKITGIELEKNCADNSSIIKVS